MAPPSAPLSSGSCHFSAPWAWHCARGVQSAGNRVSIKPILAVDDGKIVLLEKVRSAARAIARLEEVVVADAATRPPGQVRLAVHHFGNAAEAEQLAARLAAALPDSPPAQISSLPAVLAAHAGLGVLA